ncbi:hypothetical protein LAUMK21_00953 [Mycobacterium pseudokansasii]|nr:hypothetical protein LAUMK21_00953 [Mycobacterium pseudokansasii]
MLLRARVRVEALRAVSSGQRIGVCSTCWKSRQSRLGVGYFNCWHLVNAPVTQLASGFPATLSAISKHLAILAEVGVGYVPEAGA